MQNQSLHVHSSYLMLQRFQNNPLWHAVAHPDLNENSNTLKQHQKLRDIHRIFPQTQTHISKTNGNCLKLSITSDLVANHLTRRASELVNMALALAAWQQPINTSRVMPTAGPFLKRKKSLRRHPFFVGISWETVWLDAPPPKKKKCCTHPL